MRARPELQTRSRSQRSCPSWMHVQPEQYARVGRPALCLVLLELALLVALADNGRDGRQERRVSATACHAGRVVDGLVAQDSIRSSPTTERSPAHWVVSRRSLTSPDIIHTSDDISVTSVTKLPADPETLRGSKSTCLIAPPGAGASGGPTVGSCS